MLKFVYFDLGGVIYIDFSKTNKWHELVEEIGISKGKEQEFLHFWDYNQKKICTGLDIEDLVPEIINKFGAKFPKNYSLLKDGFVSRFDLNKSLWPVIVEINKYCKIGLLTNQYPNMFHAGIKKGLLPNVSWDVIVDSSIVGFQKPDREIFKYAEKQSGVKGKEILFIDNTFEHIDVAKTFGWQTYLYDSSNPIKSSKDLLDFFKKN